MSVDTYKYESKRIAMNTTYIAYRAWNYHRDNERLRIISSLRRSHCVCNMLFFHGLSVDTYKYESLRIRYVKGWLNGWERGGSAQPQANRNNNNMRILHSFSYNRHSLWLFFFLVVKRLGHFFFFEKPHKPTKFKINYFFFDKSTKHNLIRVKIKKKNCG